MENMKLGPNGGEGGLPIEECAIPAGARICEVQVSSGWFVDSIRVQYVDATGETQALPSIGGRGLLSHYFTLEAGEYLIGISGRSGQYVDSIVFHTNQRISPTYGGSGGDDFTLLAPEGSEVVGFFGRAGWFVDAIGIVTRPLSAVQPVPGKAAETAAETAAAGTATAAPKKAAKKAAAKSQQADTPAPAAPEKPVKKAKKAASAPVAEPAVVEPTAVELPAATRSAAVVALAPDDLKIIEGIGPKIAELLAQNGIATFATLADASAEQLRTLLLAAGRRFAVSDPTTWPAQAALAATGDMDALKAMQADLKGGRKAG